MITNVSLHVFLLIDTGMHGSHTQILPAFLPFTSEAACTQWQRARIFTSMFEPISPASLWRIPYLFPSPKLSGSEKNMLLYHSLQSNFKYNCEDWEKNKVVHLTAIFATLKSKYSGQTCIIALLYLLTFLTQNEQG